MDSSIQKRILVFTLSVVLLSLTVAGCDSSPSSGSEAIIARSKRQRQTSSNVTQAALSELGTGNSAFAFDLYQAIQEQEGNLFYSPYSISIALAMTYAGARHDTERQMTDTLHFSLPQDQFHTAFNALDLKLTSQSKDNQDQGTAGFNLKIADSIWGQVGYSFRPEFLDTLADNYGAGLRLVDFMNESERERSRLTINQWVSDQTEGKIQNLLDRGLLTEDTRLVLANAIYFKAEWEVPFLNGTADDTFTPLNGDQVTVPMMSRRAETRYAEGDGYQAIEISYKGDRMRMVILLPAPGQFEVFERSLDDERLNVVLQSLTPADLKLYMPKFKYEAALSLADILAGMGMPDAFNPQTADFSGMDGTRNLFISHVVHKAFVSMDEMGTEAAAATGVIGEQTSMPIVLKLDRPFIFVIRDVGIGTILFIGRVVNPAS